MTKRFKAMCACNKCGVPAEVQESLNLKQLRVFKKLKSEFNSMRDGREKTFYLARMKKCEDEIMEDKKMKYDRASKAINDMICPPLEINGESMHKFACVMGHCQ